MPENSDQTGERADSPDKPLSTDGGASSSDPGEESPEAVLDTVEDSLTDEGFGVFRGRQFISIRASGQLAPNSTVAEEHLQDAAAVMLAYNESDNDIAVIPLEQAYDKPNVFSLNSGSPPTISAREFMRAHQLTPEKTAR